MGEDDAAALARECREELGVDVLTSFGVALAEPSDGTFLSVRLISRWRGEPRNAAPEEHDEIGFYSVDEVAELRLADDRYLPLLTAALRPPESVEICRLDEERWDSVGELHALSRQETYSPLLPPPPQLRFRPADLAACWRARAAAEGESLLLHGGWSDKVLLGFVATSMVAPPRAELNALHVRPDWHGRGLAEWLHRAALAHVGGQGGRELHLWVLADNVRARRFYEKHGWRRAGGHRMMIFGAAALPAIDYARSL